MRLLSSIFISMFLAQGTMLSMDRSRQAGKEPIVEKNMRDEEKIQKIKAEISLLTALNLNVSLGQILANYFISELSHSEENAEENNKHE